MTAPVCCFSLPFSAASSSLNTVPGPARLLDILLSAIAMWLTIRVAQKDIDIKKPFQDRAN